MTDTTTQPTAETTLDSVVDTYLAAWSEADEQERARLIETAWAPEGSLVDPPLEGHGYDGISDMAVAMQTHFAGHTFRRVSGIDVHHDRFRFGWELVGPDGAVALNGIDVGEVAPDGRLRRITGFFGDLPERS